MILLYCKYCEEEVNPIVTDQSIHKRADCSLCGKWIKWLPKTQDKQTNEELLTDIKANINKLKGLFQK